ncbi:DUF192 domain-containing protein [Patescibacteria group bacterium]|nr:DUF192 domain-containing protein [Patescibacteria group bacterium]MBU4512647.1 DUF192 domain-containing protein [Patescibacteria group bacterium]MCG2693553.1 DUF192 domain-containing protein [Candidatus Parcubacteria bacterium]
MKFKLSIIFILVLALVGCASKKHVELKIGNAKVKAEVVSSLVSRAQGLSGREFLAQNQGMLFVFDEPARYSFVMREMKFPLDIIFIRNNKIVDFTENLPVPEPGEDSANYTTKEPANYALEVNAGFIQQHELKVGDGVDIGR